jgi:hypothetical protein
MSDAYELIIEKDLDNSVSSFQSTSGIIKEFRAGTVWHDLQMFLRNYIEGCRDQMEVEQSQQNLMALQMECKIARLMIELPARLQAALEIEERRSQ